MTELQDLSERQQAFLLIAALKEGERAPQLLDFVGEARSGAVRAVLDGLVKLPKKTRDEELPRALAKLSPQGKVSLFSHADAGWVVEALKGESPLVWALVFRELPRAKVGKVLSELPKELRKHIKAMVNNVPSDKVWSLLKQKLEARFPRVSREVLEHSGPFENFRNLTADQFMQLMREVGLAELALAFSKVDKTATRAILHRLSVGDAKELRRRIKKGEVHSSESMREAQMNILSLEVEKLKTDELTLEIGFSVFSRAFVKEHFEIAPLFIYKLSPRHGYVFKRYLDINMYRNTPDAAAKVWERVASALDRIRPQFE